MTSSFCIGKCLEVNTGSILDTETFSSYLVAQMEVPTAGEETNLLPTKLVSSLENKNLH